ncbi:adenosylcobinamide kinase /adenosylcobinamide-phosphate guanylyltransferase [Friedmanniella luteola]|uniref:Adenosylcobinamide kinase n=1 Tax=Friedmanniella luteola TaxID=546871 RepID=A0A1H2A2C9_9ACTN|nr:bifunctional adenosylcobinamide kinase/adenosylcobinamide-phosphate guanylyltransferase [Friedmanniella luteola]SDT40060.1 adenosylcobinamide kinase /adenosylcobinamide-phosphate guanylyltransferase [Friedmanniella luteola]
MSSPQKVLVTGGVRSGKSRHAEALLAGSADVTYVAPGAVPDPVADPEWAARVAAHRASRPASWRTVETTDVAAALRGADGPVLVDCLGTWVTAVVDDLGTWDQPLAGWRDRFDVHLDGLLDAWRAHPALVVAVTNEVGWGLVSEHRSGRVFTDLLGRANQAVARHCDDIVLVVAGRALHL